MGKTSKVVRFYEPVVLDQKDQRQPISGSFWRDLSNSLSVLPVQDRQHEYVGVNYYGEARVGVSPALAYLYVGRLRDPSDHPDTFDPLQGITGVLPAPGRGGRLSEPTYLLPFGASNHVAVMNPSIGGTRIRALEAWTSAMCGLLPTGNRVEFAPIVDQRVLDKVRDAEGATRLYVRIEPDAQVPAEGGGRVAEAIRQAAAHRVPDAYLDLTWSFGHMRPTDDRRRPLLQAAQWLGRRRWADKVEVSLQIPDGDGFRVESHNLFRDKIALAGTFDLEEGRAPTEEEVLKAMLGTVEEFRRRA